jgi:CubicO group peptidase (beta-lactamase class C family)
VTARRGARGSRPPRRAHLASRRYGLRSSVLAPRLDALFEKLDTPGHPGGMVAVLRGGEVVHLAAYGVASVEHDLPFDARSVLRLGSTTKHLAATAILLLEDRGLLAIDDDVRRYLPELPDLGASITLRHLLTMTSGIPDGLTRFLFAGHSARHPMAQSSLVELYRRGRTLLFPPGEQCSYSNTNYSLLAMVLERLSGTTLRAFLRRELFEPFGMTRTDLVPDEREVVPGLATGYEPAEESTPIGTVAAGFPTRSFFPVELSADGGVAATLDDLVRWLQHLRRSDGPVRQWRERLEQEGVLADGERTGYGLGFAVDSHRGLRKVGHAGGMPGYLCDLALFEDPSGRLERDIGFVALWNWMEPSLLDSAVRVADVVLEAEGWPPSGSNNHALASPTTPNEPSRSAQTAPASDRIAGLYACLETGELMHVVERDGLLSGFYLGEATPLLREEDGSLRGAKRGLGFSLRPVPGDAAAGALEARFGASQPRIFRPVAVPTTSGTDSLDEYAGRYRSDELGEEMIVAVANDGGALAVRLASPLRPLLWRELRRLEGDLFYAAIAGCPTVTNVSALFRRDASGRVATLVHQTSRAGSIAFERSRE